MTGETAADRPADDVRRGFPRPRTWITLIVIVAVGVTALGARHPGGPPMTALAVVALAAWAAGTLLDRPVARTTAFAAAAACGSLAAGTGSSVLIAPVIAAAVVLIADRRIARAAPPVVLGGAVLVLVAAAVLSRQPAAALVALLGGTAFGVLLGFARRAAALADARQRALAAAALEAEREADRTRLLEDRAAIARDLHDVLAHSLGGLVVQLDAALALLEHGRADEAAHRAARARGLAAEGLAEARQAVAALRDDASGPRPTPRDALERLVATHRELGAAVQVQGDLALDGLDAAHREALARALQESLANARRHAPGAPVRIVATRSTAVLALEVRTALMPDALVSPGGGRGLTGMRERFAALGDASRASADADGGEFVVEAEAVLS